MDALETPATTPPVSNSVTQDPVTGAVTRKFTTTQIVIPIVTAVLFGAVTKYGLKKSNAWAIGASVLGAAAAVVTLTYIHDASLK